MSEILAAIAAIPAIIQGVRDLIGFLEQEFGPNWPQRLQDLKTASQQWSAAQTTEERANAAKALAAAFNSHK